MKIISFVLYFSKYKKDEKADKNIKWLAVGNGLSAATPIDDRASRPGWTACFFVMFYGGNMFFKLFLLSLGITLFGQSQELEFRNLYNQGTRCFQKGNYDSSVIYFRMANDLRPNTHSVKYNLAAALSCGGKTVEATEILKEDFWLSATDQFLSDSDFVNLWKSGYIEDLKRYLKQFHEIHEASKPAFELDDRAFHPEGLALDKITGRFFIGSIRKKTIWVYKNEKIIKDFFKTDSLYAVMGMKVDEKRRKLWVATSIMPEMDGYVKSMQAAAVYCFDIDKGNIDTKYSLFGDHVLGDLVLDKDGTVYVTDSREPVIYRIKENTMERWLSIDKAWNLQGLDFSEDQKYLYVADYISGLFKINMANGETSHLFNKNPLRGIDGLYRWGKGFVVTQNGTNPMKVSKLILNKDQTVVEEQVVLERSDILNEPTLGFLDKNQFYYIANSPWGAYNREGKFVDERAQNPRVYKIILEP